MTKYTNDHGVRKYNPKWHPPADAPIVTALPLTNQATALPVVSYPNHQPGYFDEEIVVAPSYQQAAEQYNEIIVEAEIVVDSQDDALEQLSGVLARYEVPAGLLAKLLMLSDFEMGEILVDDSGSMNARTDAKGAQGQTLTRWQEAKQRIEEMMELVAYVPSPPFFVRFLNRTTVLELKRELRETPQMFVQRVNSMLEKEFVIRPQGLTPALEQIRASLGRFRGQSVLRYFFGDGVPNGGEQACEQIAQLLIHRSDPARNPFTFMSCTNEDGATEWMKECEEVAPYCAEFDDYYDESREILKDQGKAFPYSYGLHLVGQLAAAFNPHDLDAMDESVPFTQSTLQDLLGYQVSPEEYKYYFDSFIAAQQRMPLTSAQRGFVGKLPDLCQDFVQASRAADIPAVASYRLQMKQVTARQQQYKQTSRASGPDAECCVIL